MARKTYMLSLFAFLCMAFSLHANRCDNLYAKVTYSLNHAKKGMTATNFEHQMYYAERAMVALEKSKEFQAECGCAKMENKTQDVIEVLAKAVEPFDWEAGRFYTKKSMGLINELITSLDECTQNDPADIILEDEEEVTLQHEAYPNNEQSAKDDSLEQEMVKVFDDHATARLDSARKAVEKLVLLSKTLNPHTENNGNPESLIAHQRAYLEEAKKILEEGIQALDSENR